MFTHILKINHTAYMTIQDLLKRVARGELSSCGGLIQPDTNINDEVPYIADKTKRDARMQDSNEDDEYYYDDIPHISDDSTQENSLDINHQNELYTETPAGVADIMDQLGDADIVICDNLERALYLSLKYEFVTPLTSLVVVKPDSEDYGEFGEAGRASERQRTLSFDIMYSSDVQITGSSFIILVGLLMNLLLKIDVV